MFTKELSNAPRFEFGKIYERTKTVPIYVSGILKEITPLATKYAPPKISAKADVSPKQPPVFPKNISKIRGSSPPDASFKMDSGVAEETTSTGINNPVVNGRVHLVIITGHEASKNALPAKAGFIKLCPVPPKNCFAIIIATNEPIRHIHHGAETGKLKARIIPVTAAVPSDIVMGLFVIFCHKNSKPMENKTQRAVKISALNPKKITEQTKEGMSAMQTSVIILDVVQSDLI